MDDDDAVAVFGLGRGGAPEVGLPEILARTPADDSPLYLSQVQAVQKLASPAEMGERFKVMALGKGIEEPLLGFAEGDRSEML